MKSKKIIIVTRSMYAGGAERVIAQLANYFNSEGIVCKIVTIDNEKILYKLNNTIEILPIGMKSKNKLFDKISRYSILRTLIRKERPDVVLSMPEDIGIYVILALLGLNIPVFVSERNNPWVMPDKKITRLLRKFMYPFATGLVFQTEMAKSFFPSKIQDKGIVLPNPIDVSRIPKQHKGERKKVIVGAGRLDKQKNFSLLIRAFGEFSKKHPDYSLHIYGDGGLRNSLEQQIEKLDLIGKVELLGRKNDLLERMNSSAMFVLSSDYEGMPNVLLEAMCMGMPVISTDCPSGGPRELINHGVNGLLIDVGDETDLLQAMERLTDETYAEQLCKQAYLLRDKLTSQDIFSEWKAYLFR